MRDDELEMRDTKGQNIVFGRAKLGIQLERNRNMHRAFEAVQKSDVSRGHKLAKVWKIEGSKKRSITMDNQDVLFKKRMISLVHFSLLSTT